jgi:hypothetical protein
MQHLKYFLICQTCNREIDDRDTGENKNEIKSDPLRNQIQINADAVNIGNNKKLTIKGFRC